MSTQRKVRPEEELLYLLSKNSQGSIVLGRKKLMKLVFFSEFYDTDLDELVPDQKLGSFDFEIFKYGPFSRTVLEHLDRLKESGLVREDSSRMQYVIKITSEGESRIEEIERRIPKEKKKQIEEISQDFSGKSGGQLENLSLDLLGIEKREKDKFRGLDVSPIIKGSYPSV